MTDANVYTKQHIRDKRTDEGSPIESAPTLVRSDPLGPWGWPAWEEDMHCSVVDCTILLRDCHPITLLEHVINS